MTPKSMRVMIPVLLLFAATGARADVLEEWLTRVVGPDRRTTFVDGFADIVAAPARGNYRNPRGGSVPSAWVYTRSEKPLVWRSGPVPADVDTPFVTFAWEGMLTGGANMTLGGKSGPFTFTLSMKGTEPLTFAAGIGGDTRWKTADGAELFFDMTVSDAYYDLGGILFLTVPRDRVRPGEPVEFRVAAAGAPAKCFFMLSCHRDTVAHLASGAVKDNPTTFVPPKFLTKEDFHYDGSGLLKMIVRKGNDLWQGLDEVKSRVNRRRTVNGSCERVVFRDTYTFNEVWLLSRYNARHHYSTLLAFNANGSLIKIGGIPRGLYDMTSARPVDWRPKGGGEWDRVRPDIRYGARRSSGRWDNPDQLNEIFSVNIRTGEKKVLATAKGRIGFWPQSDDGKIVWWQEGPQDVGYRVGLCTVDGENLRRVHVTGGIHQAYLIREPQERGQYWLYNHAANTVDAEGKVIGGRRHVVVDLMTGEIPAPAFAGVHEAHSPDGWAIFAGRAGSLYPDRMKPHRIVSVVQQLETHTTWNSFERHWAAEAYNAPDASDIIKLNPWTDDVIIVCSANQNPQDHVTWGTCQFPNLSPDGTKILYFSSMLQGKEKGHEYIAVAKRPEPPIAVKAERRGSDVTVSWQPHDLSRETIGYHVLRSRESGSEYEVVGNGRIDGHMFVDKEAPRGQLFYRVRAQEFSGLVSGFSRAAAVQAEGVPRRVFVEAESGTCQAPMRVTMDGRCANDHLAYVSEYPEETVGTLKVQIPVPIKDTYNLWIRAAARQAGRVQVRADEEASKFDLPETSWRWFRIGRHRLAAGELTVELSTDAKGLMFDRFILCGDLDWVPKATGAIDDTAPSTPEGWQVAQTRADGARLLWDLVPEQDVGHYNIYCADRPDFECGQANLILSIPASDHVAEDWGLEAGAVRYYRITAVDWDRNESVPSAPIKAR
ncbi:MAG: hypothetical protein HQ559_05540 [Lentisphaerae bacterium]|nr:hypothetical protein [Lentisphaerota bacterium]